MSILTRSHERLGRIVARGEALLASVRRSDGLGDEAALLAWRLTAVTIVANLVHEKHHYRRELQRIAHERMLPARALEQTLGVLHGLGDDLESGALGDVRGLLRGQLLFDLLDRAEDHYERGYIEAAAILLVTILEDQLRSLSALNDLPPQRSLELMSASLRKAGLVSGETHRAVARWSELGQRLIQHTAPAERAEVAELLDGVARFLDENPATHKTPPRDWQAAPANAPDGVEEQA